MPDASRPAAALTRGPGRRAVLAAGLACAWAAGCSHAPASRADPVLWRDAAAAGLAFGSSAATWELADAAFARLFRTQAAVLLTEDDLLWYRVRPAPDAALDFDRADRVVAFAESARQSVIGAHLVWDDGFGPGWGHRRAWRLPRARARHVLYGTVDALVHRYRGRVATWSVVNEAIAAAGEPSAAGLRADVPWFATCGPGYVADAFHVAHAADPSARLVLNDNGFESGAAGARKRRNALAVVDALLADNVPVQAFGIQGHLVAARFAERFDAAAYRRFLGELADRGLELLITELDVLDDGLPADPRRRDRGVADVYSRYLNCVLDEPAVTAVLTFGLSDRYTWLQQDYPRRDRARRRPLPFDQALRPTPSLAAIAAAFGHAPARAGRFRVAR